MLRVCQVVSNINRDVGGPAVTVPRLSEALTKEDVACVLFTLNYKRLGPQTEGMGYELISITGNYFTRQMRALVQSRPQGMSNWLGHVQEIKTFRRIAIILAALVNHANVPAFRCLRVGYHMVKFPHLE